MDEVLSLVPHGARLVVDFTVGSGGHTEAILKLLGEAAQVIGFDRDVDALARTNQRLKAYNNQLRLVHDSYANFDLHLGEADKGKVDFALLDLGLSSDQLEHSNRGFAHQASNDALDLRFDKSSGQSLSTKLSQVSVNELTQILREYGEVDRAHRIAEAIISAADAGQLATVADLVSVVTPYLKREKTKQGLSQIWQALRIWVNDELEQLNTVLPKIVDYLRVDGVLAVISFHSLEDRAVKQFMVAQENPCICPPRVPVCVCGRKPLLRRITRKAIMPGEAEISRNQRSRSARLRAAAKLGTS